jgi:hypothetical protein
MKLNLMEEMCNKWEKTENKINKTFTLSYKLVNGIVCGCDNTPYTHLKDYNEYECYNCGIKKREQEDGEGEEGEGVPLYLQNSGTQDIVCVKPILNPWCHLCEIPGVPDAYKWATPTDGHLIFALHIKNNMLSDEDVSDTLDSIFGYCQWILTENV